MCQSLFTNEPLSRDYDPDEDDWEFVRYWIAEYRTIEKFGYDFLHSSPPTTAFVWRMTAILASEMAAQQHLHNKSMNQIEAESSNMRKSIR